MVANLRLKDVKKIYIDVRDDAELRRDLVAGLGSSGVVAATTNADEADASLRIALSQTSDTQIDASARLVNARGVVLWPKRGGRRYSDEKSKVLSDIVRDLLSEIRAARTAKLASPERCSIPPTAVGGYFSRYLHLAP